MTMLYPTKEQLDAYVHGHCAVAAGSAQWREHEKSVIEKYGIETLRHAANAIFNKLNEAHFCGTHTEQGKQALFDAQALADVIVSSQAATAAIGPNVDGQPMPDPGR